LPNRVAAQLQLRDGARLELSLFQWLLLDAASRQVRPSVRPYCKPPFSLFGTAQPTYVPAPTTPPAFAAASSRAVDGDVLLGALCRAR
jgi:hypothetical protein